MKKIDYINKELRRQIVYDEELQKLTQETVKIDYEGNG